MATQIVNPNATPADQEYKKHMLEQGLSLLTMAPIVFPEYMLLQGLQKQRDNYKTAMLVRFWRDNGPWALLRSMKLNNAEHNVCNCANCNVNNGKTRLTCRFWDKFTWDISQCGMLYTVIRFPCNQACTWSAVAAQAPTFLTNVPSTTTPPGESFDTDKPPADFDPLTACLYMAPVSHMDVHLVFQRVGNVLGITYGRRLWQEDDLMGINARKLDMLFAKLHTC